MSVYENKMSVYENKMSVYENVVEIIVLIRIFCYYKNVFRKGVLMKENVLKKITRFNNEV
ncbi:hypothetical protein J2Z59_001632, partial [Jeotgalicoccus pinnipedialis]|nr:hypothetical protein [Jeotgalicoccus pinnipedialis]